MFFHLQHILLSHLAQLCDCFYKLGRKATSPKLRGMVLFMGISSLVYVVPVTLAGYGLGVPEHSGGPKLKWVWAGVVLGFSLQSVLWRYY